VCIRFQSFLDAISIIKQHKRKHNAMKYEYNAPVWIRFLSFLGGDFHPRTIHTQTQQYNTTTMQFNLQFNAIHNTNTIHYTTTLI